MKNITVATSFNLAEAGLVCSRLEAAGFHLIMGNEMASSWLVGTMSTATMLRIEVPEDKAADAKEFLAAPAE